MNKLDALTVTGAVISAGLAIAMLTSLTGANMVFYMHAIVITSMALVYRAIGIDALTCQIMMTASVAMSLLGITALMFTDIASQYYVIGWFVAKVIEVINELGPLGVISVVLGLAAYGKTLKNSIDAKPVPTAGKVTLLG